MKIMQSNENKCDIDFATREERSLSFSWRQIPAGHHHQVGEHERRQHAVDARRQSLLQHVDDVGLENVFGVGGVGVSFDFTKFCGKQLGVGVPVPE